jgi:hypothetical protein
MEIETKIDGFTVTFFDYGEDCCDVHIGSRNFSSSLALMQHLGGFEDDCGNVIAVNPSTIEKIQTWADAQGY